MGEFSSKDISIGSLRYGTFTYMDGGCFSLNGTCIYLDLPKGAKWFLKGVNSPSLRV